MNEIEPDKLLEIYKRVNERITKEIAHEKKLLIQWLKDNPSFADGIRYLNRVGYDIQEVRKEALTLLKIKA